MRLSRLRWMVRQLLPLQYHSLYYQSSADMPERREAHYCVWRMWMGRSFNINDRVVG